MTAVVPPGEADLPLTARLVHRLAERASRRGPSTRRSFLARMAVAGTALAANPLRFILRPGTAYAQVTGCGDGAGCGSGWTVFCVTVAGNRGKNTCPPGSYAAGWWKADSSAFCKGLARYYVDCNRLPSQPGSCSCVLCYNQGTCDVRRYCCNAFRYGQCNQHIIGVTPVVCRVITCTPPWQWDPACTATSRTDNRTATHTAPELPGPGASDIAIKYQDLGLLGSTLGAPTVPEALAPGNGRRADYQHGSIVFRADTGAHSLRTPVRDEWVARGGGAGALAYPTSDTLVLNGGFRNDFALADAVIAWTSTTGAHVVRGGIRAKWRELGGPNLPLGYPVSDEEPTAGGGGQSRFQGGVVLYKSGIGARGVWGQINATYQALGGPGGSLGYPLTDELSTGGTRGGRVSWFEHGAIFFTPATGAHDVRNPALSEWYRRGGPTGPIGFPVTNDIQLAGGCQWGWFENASIVSRADIGTKVVVGAINIKYVQLGGPTSFLALPLTDELGMGDGRGRVSWFQEGSIFWTATTGAHEVHNPILSEWFRRGGPAALGYPLSDTEHPSPGVDRVTFERGTITWDGSGFS